MKFKTLYKPYIFIFLVSSLLANTSCGGGGGEYYPPEIAINKIGVFKEEVTSQNLDFKIDLESNLNLESNDKIISGYTYYSFRNFNFNNIKYKIGIPINNWVSIIDANENIIKKLETPRYTRNAAAVELVGENAKKYLAVYIDQQSTSHSSTLYILSETWDVLYKEHLLGAKWMSKETSEHGDSLIVYAEKKWRPEEKWICVGGPWKYHLFNKQ
ncbi:hypothetical protein [Mariprofundus sp. KV]|uniref:hypothetical protein n=1 Tax=Mariprofundus sp. KV TaxID=2608715 RepID=UPI0015A2C126|nr:hypothetical protein [Mariprofundus sp. KV]NWF37226.1 hypothetical protein [Mariprofundus sp. KV]